MKRNTKLFSLLIALILAFSVIACLGISAYAESKPKGPVNWQTVDNTGRTITDGSYNYTLYATTVGHNLCGEIYSYYNEIVIGNNTYYVYAPSLGSPVRYLRYNKITRIYVREGSDGSVFDDFLANSYESARIGIGEISYTVIDAPDGLIDTLLSITEKTDIDVTELNGNLVYTVYTYDSSDTLKFTYGAIYLHGGEMYFVNYSTLDNNYFDGNGDFSYRQGTVAASKLDNDTALMLETKLEENSYYHPTRYITETFDGSFDDGSPIQIPEEVRKVSPLVISIIIIILAGYAPSCVIVAFSLRKLLKSKKEDREAGLYLILSGGAVWLICSIIITFIIYI